MPRRSDARTRAIRAASRLFQQQGYHGTGLAQILAESGAPKGSFYYYFPQGKEQLAREAIADADAQVSALLVHAERTSRDARGYLRNVMAALARWMDESDFTEGCPIASLTLEASARSTVLLTACRDAYAGWQHHVAATLRDRGIDARRARTIGVLVVTGMNGAMILCRAERTTAPFRILQKELVAHLDVRT